MKTKICQLILKMLGWKIKNSFPDVPKCVIAVAPHTSNFDFIIGKIGYGALGRQANFLMKKSWFVFPLNIILKNMGGIPVDRSKQTSITDKLAIRFKESTNLQLAITPEGTRGGVKEWKKGFYFIAFKAEIPIMLVGIDYSKKELVFLSMFTPTGDFKSDIPKIRDYYKDIKGKHPDKFVV